MICHIKSCSYSICGVCNNMGDYDCEYKDYRAIGTVKECRAAVEKQIPEQVIIKPWNPARCPTCGESLSEDLGDGYYKHSDFLERCPNPECSQRLKWEE